MAAENNRLEAQRDHAELDTTVPSAARIYDALLGGRDNFAADRQAAVTLMAAAPAFAAIPAAIEGFRRRLVTYLAGEAGVRQFIEICPAFPGAVTSTHEIAQTIAPECRVVYVDNDSVVLAVQRAMLTSAPEGLISFIDADRLDPEMIVAESRKTLNFDSPTAILLLNSLRSIGDLADLSFALAEFMAILPSGSYLAIAWPASDLDASLVAAARQWNQLGTSQITLASHEDMTSLIGGLRIAEPGVVTVPEWRPDTTGQQRHSVIPLYGVLARKPYGGPAQTASQVSATAESTLPITIYLAEETGHEQVEAAIEELLAHADLEIIERDDPIIGSWYRRLRAAVRQTVMSSAVRETALTAAHAADVRLILVQDAQITAMLLQNLGPVITSLQYTKDAVLRVGALLIVKIEWKVQVFQLTAAQQAMLDHQPLLAASPAEIIATLQLSTSGDGGHPAPSE